MLIDPMGLLYGERIGACSDEAQLHFPRLLAGSNGYGRIELSYSALTETVYRSLATKPAYDLVKQIFHEYHEHFLLFVYQAADGSVWGQWDIPAKFLPRWKTSEDKKSPAPVQAEFDAFRRCYVESRKLKYQATNDALITKDFRNLPKSSEVFGTFPHGIGVGVGVGVGDGVGEESSAPASPSPKPDEVESDPRHVPFREAVQEHFRALTGEDAPWDGSEARALKNLLRANPNLTVETFTQCLRNRAESRVQASDRPRRWLDTVTDYLSGPKDEFGKPLRPKVREPGARSNAPSADETQRRMAQERAEALEFWREQKADDKPKWKEAPAWVVRALEAEAAGQWRS